MKYTAQAGVSMLEVILAVVIAGAVITAGLNYYAVYKRDGDARQLVYNVDNLAQAAAQFYYANCYGTSIPGEALTPGLLHPASAPADPYTLSVTSVLIGSKWLGASLPLNPLVDETTAGQGYIVQLSKSERPKKICTTAPNCTDSEATQIGTIVDYNIIVGIKLRDTTRKEQFKNITNASCLSSVKTVSALFGGTGESAMVSCAEAASFRTNCLAYSAILQSTSANFAAKLAAAIGYLTTGCSGTSSSDYDNYLVYERKPSAMRSNDMPTQWTRMPIVRQFTNLYRTYPMHYLLDSSHSPEYQYYLCGS